MPLVKVKEKFQVTIPASIRQQLGLKVGDVLEAEVEDDKIVLKPKIVLDRSEALKKLFSVLEKNRKDLSEISEDEVVQDALEAIEEARREKQRKDHAEA